MLPDSQAYIYARTDKNNDGIAEIDTTKVVSYGGAKKDIIIPNGVKTIGNSAFSNNQLTSVTIPNSVTTIRIRAFYNNPNLKAITIDNAKGAISGSPWGATNATINYLR